MTIKASGSQWGGVCLGGGVDIGSTLDQQLDDVQVTGSSSTPQGWSTLYGLPIECDGAGLLHTGTAFVHQILHHVMVTIATAQHQRSGSVSLGPHQP